MFMIGEQVTFITNNIKTVLTSHPSVKSWKLRKTICNLHQPQGRRRGQQWRVVRRTLGPCNKLLHQRRQQQSVPQSLSVVTLGTTAWRMPEKGCNGPLSRLSRCSLDSYFQCRHSETPALSLRNIIY